MPSLRETGKDGLWEVRGSASRTVASRCLGLLAALQRQGFSTTDSSPQAPRAPAASAPRAAGSRCLRLLAAPQGQGFSTTDSGQQVLWGGYCSRPGGPGWRLATGPQLISAPCLETHGTHLSPGDSSQGLCRLMPLLICLHQIRNMIACHLF